MARMQNNNTLMTNTYNTQSFFIICKSKIDEPMLIFKAYTCLVMTRMLPDLKNMSYPERLKILDLTTLESRKLRFDRGIQDSKGF